MLLLPINAPRAALEKRPVGKGPHAHLRIAFMTIDPRLRIRPSSLGDPVQCDAACPILDDRTQPAETVLFMSAVLSSASNHPMFGVLEEYENET
jgi:hypothetical protein